MEAYLSGPSQARGERRPLATEIPAFGHPLLPPSPSLGLTSSTTAETNDESLLPTTTGAPSCLHHPARPPGLPPAHQHPEPPLQPDHFYGNEDVRFPPSPNSDGRTWLDPADDPLAQRGIPVFKPTMEEFVDFEAYMNRVEPWGMRSGIVKVIPPKEWTAALPSVVPQLENVKLKNPIEQHMLGQGGLFQQQNIEKRRVMSVREWAELCAKEDLRAPGVEEVGLHARAANGATRRTRRSRKHREKSPQKDGFASLKARPTGEWI
ncbi:hypothetical protein NUW54_g1999 [Trametes sanguinea]|uniref:Uncharacterized protein n=1 Tax=Trametes sanguinea TaxID=158606 RepID=A0ACC1Q6F9_9APHY|nr:hypothetical protein NUW54_g1999 [Trametes sanguinea]